MADTDSMVLAGDPEVTTCLAAYLNAAMARNASAREAYRAMWGAEWAPLGHGAEINDGASSMARTAL